VRSLPALLLLWQIDICNLEEAVTQQPPDGNCQGGAQSIKYGLFRNYYSDVKNLLSVHRGSMTAERASMHTHARTHRGDRKGRVKGESTVCHLSWLYNQ
jgi:hypothetical protein